MDKGDYVTISPDVNWPWGHPYRETMEVLYHNESVGIVTDDVPQAIEVHFLIDGKDGYFLFGREELDFAPISLLSALSTLTSPDAMPIVFRAEEVV